MDSSLSSSSSISSLSSSSSSVSSSKKRLWSTEEDKTLIGCVQEHGPRNWNKLARISGGVVPDQPELLPHSLDNSFRSSRFSEFGGPADDDEVGKGRPLALKNKPPRWNRQLQCWCINFHGRVTVSSVKNFQLIAAATPTPSSQPPEHDKIILQFGKVDKDLFTGARQRSAFQAFEKLVGCVISYF